MTGVKHVLGFHGIIVNKHLLAEFYEFNALFLFREIRTLELSIYINEKLETSQEVNLQSACNGLMTYACAYEPGYIQNWTSDTTFQKDRNHYLRNSEKFIIVHRFPRRKVYE